jgi:cyclopentanol dehydrogenase
MDRLKDKVAIVSGGARGMGRATAELFAKEGAKVVAGDLRDAEGAAESEVDFVKLDVTQEDSWNSVVADTVAKYGKLDIVVNNAAVITYEPILETTLDVWNNIVNVDQLGVFLGMKAAIPEMIKNGGGSIVNFSSIWGLVGADSAAAYHAAKGAVVNMSRNVASTHAKDGIRVNSVHPGYILTPMNADQAPEINAALTAGTLLKRPGQPIEVAYAVLFLASDESSYVNATAFLVDGGISGAYTTAL